MNKEIRKNWVESGKSLDYKTPCTSAILQGFNIAKNEYRYSQTARDIISILRRKGYTVRSRGSKYKYKTVGKIRNKLTNEFGLYLIWVKGHVLLLSYKGHTIIDTFPMHRDKRKILGIWGITNICIKRG